mmetsp:Transcript_6349/g.9250  ORF Transcript_6349/g.9250 Transcript_6349/m.9250 type:complete len:208 (+) Transcript_6349:84-707(+)|eukprot:CAMPEP_0117428632 /NCGR_PEP_ID=MMETSP0758-20121206/8295_1 /TAXON_ID=63605 /ORGANISM="Percolomonas cosmopolitus, Strain AE-1 (ATCC 50343)" /LENGTH=207 /DNA_ID=CAMNT_0005215093 /DNA_START=28 /DNA_END=651 /DNA_ORIENTATION=-
MDNNNPTVYGNTQNGAYMPYSETQPLTSTDQQNHYAPPQETQNYNNNYDKGAAYAAPQANQYPQQQPSQNPYQPPQNNSYQPPTAQPYYPPQNNNNNYNNNNVVSQPWIPPHEQQYVSAPSKSKKEQDEADLLAAVLILLLGMFVCTPILFFLCKYRKHENKSVRTIYYIGMVLLVIYGVLAVIYIVTGFVFAIIRLIAVAAASGGR